MGKAYFNMAEVIEGKGELGEYVAKLQNGEVKFLGAVSLKEADKKARKLHGIENVVMVYPRAEHAEENNE